MILLCVSLGKQKEYRAFFSFFLHKPSTLWSSYGEFAKYSKCQSQAALGKTSSGVTVGEQRGESPHKES